MIRTVPQCNHTIWFNPDYCTLGGPRTPSPSPNLWVRANTLLIGGGRHKTAVLVITSLKGTIVCGGWVKYWLSPNYVINYVISSLWQKFKLVLVSQEERNNKIIHILSFNVHIKHIVIFSRTTFNLPSSPYPLFHTNVNIAGGVERTGMRKTNVAVIHFIDKGEKR